MRGSGRFQDCARHYPDQGKRAAHRGAAARDQPSGEEQPAAGDQHVPPPGKNRIRCNCGSGPAGGVRAGHCGS